MRELYRLNKDCFPDSGAILYLLKRTDSEIGIKDEMLKLAEWIKIETSGVGNIGDGSDG